MIKDRGSYMSKVEAACLAIGFGLALLLVATLAVEILEGTVL